MRVKITADYNGDFNTIKNNLNACIEALGGVATATNQTADTLAVEHEVDRQNAQDCVGFFAATGRHQPADEQQRRRNVSPGQHRGIRYPAGDHESEQRGHRR